jgi:F-type H+-transporting ATPase subunit gamma
MLTGVENPQRAGILVVTSDRGLAGGYSANAIKRANVLADQLESEGKEVVRYVIGRKGVAYFRFRRIQLAGSWTGFSEQPNFIDARPATEAVVSALTASMGGQDEHSEPGIDELYVIYTQFKNSVTQIATAVQVSPVPMDDVAKTESDDSDDDGPKPLYDFEPEADKLIAALLPRYISARIFFALLESAASESAARRRAMKSASDNAKDLIDSYTRLANQARQAEITQEISEIVGGADALASAGSEQR